MFRKNDKHLQIPFISQMDNLPKKQLDYIENSWSQAFYDDFFSQIDETPFDVLYADCPSRPNIPINVLVSLEFLKASNGWSDKELFEGFNFNILVRKAVGYRNLGEGDFDLRTLYYFRKKLCQYMQNNGINLIEKAFEQVTDKQIDAYQIKTGKQRMDSTQVASNIYEFNRLRLMVEVIQRVHRMMSEEEQKKYADFFAPFIKGHSGQYIYHIKGQNTSEHMQLIGELIQYLISELQPKYDQDAVYRMLERVFGEHFRVEEKTVKIKVEKELSASSLQSPDDKEATYREKGKKSYKGYVINVTETCEPENAMQLITKVQTAPNQVEDVTLMIEAMPDLKKRTEIEILYTDGGYGSPEADQILQENSVEQIQTAIRGRTPSTEKLNLADFDIQQSQSGTPTQITCPAQQKVEVQQSSQKRGYVAHFEKEICETCPLKQKCAAQSGKRDMRWHLRFNKDQVNVSQRRRRSIIHKLDGRNLRAAIEATVRQVKHPFPAGKLPVRGLFRVACMAIGSAAVCNIRRIQRYLEAKKKLENGANVPQKGGQSSKDSLFVSIYFWLKVVLGVWDAPFMLRKLKSGC